MATVPAVIGSGQDLTIDNIKNTYGDLRDLTDRDRDNFRDRDPVASIGYELGGGLATGLIGGAKIAGAKVLEGVRPLLKTAAIGGGEGLIYGAGSAESGDTINNSLETGAIGATVLPVLGAGAGKLKDVALNKFDDVIAYFSKRLTDGDDLKAERVVRRMMEKEGLTPDEVVSRYEELGSDGMLVDVGDNFRALGRATVDRLGEAKSIAGELFNNRQMGQQKRLLSSLEESIGIESGDYRAVTEAVKTQRFESAKPFYDEAFEEGFKPRFSEEMVKLLDTTVMKNAMRNANKFAELEGEKIVNPLQQLHYAKMHLDTVIEAQMKKSPTYARKLIGFKNRLLDEMDKASPAYKQGRDLWAGDSQLLDAAKQGEKLFNRGVDSDELIHIVKGMSKSEREMFQLGAMRNVKNILDDTDMNADATKKLLGKERMRQRLALVFDDSSMIEDFIKKAEIEKQFTISKNAVKGGSQTSTNQQAGAALDAEVNVKWLPENKGGDMVTLGAEIAKNLTVGGKPNDNVVKRVTNLLLNSDLPESEIRRILNEQGAPKVIEAIRKTRLSDGAVPAIESIQ